MKIYCLRTLYETGNLGFSTEGVIYRGTVQANLVRQRKLPGITHEITVIGPDGKKKVVVGAVDRTFCGHPLLLEIGATDQRPDSILLVEIRAELEARTAELAAILTWSLPGTVGIRLADALFWRAPGDPADKWTWEDVTPITIGGFFPTLDDLTSQNARAERIAKGRTSAPFDVVMTAMRWWRHGLHAGAPVDKLIAYWIVLETASTQISENDSIAARVEDTLTVVFPGLGQLDAGRRTKRMKEVLYSARCKAVHAGRREFPSILTLVELTRVTASACIGFLIDQCRIPRKRMFWQPLEFDSHSQEEVGSAPPHLHSCLPPVFPLLSRGGIPGISCLLRSRI
jgi:hypothetical protein